jgi:peptidoglycan/LPS O-acetylase OafA/YrhL
MPGIGRIIMATRALHQPVSAERDSAAAPGKRRDIQGVRALAVVLVVLFHLWPERVTGGYVGVDVFFVISGFLITAHLLGEVERTGTVSLTHFWARRIRRLLPAAFTVLAASLVAAFVIVPKSVLQQTLYEIGASAVYAQNWLLAANSVDYLAADNTPSLVQHYWTLSVEEQFYFVWPILMLAALWIGRRWRPNEASRRRAILVAVACVFGASLAFSVYETAVSQSSAYFVTPTRAWEFAAGALLAFCPAWTITSARVRRALKLGLSWGGVALIGYSALSFDAATAFPGYLALIPVAGAAMILYAGESDSRWSTSQLFNLAPVQKIGDLSYAIYLWHWPLVVIFPFAFKTDLNFPGRLAIIALSLTLAYATQRFIEDPARRARFGLKQRRVTYGFAVTGMLVILAAVGVGTNAISGQQRELDRVAATAEQCMGASAVVHGNSELCKAFDVSEDRLFPALSARGEDTEGQYKCYVNAEGEGYIECTYGDVTSDIRIAVTGDSHAASLVPGLILAAEEKGWALDVMVGNGCQLGGTKCGVREKFDDRISNGEYDLILVTGKRDNQPAVDDLKKQFTRLSEAGLRIVPIVDVPEYAESTDVCVTESTGTVSSTSGCSTTRSDALMEHEDRYERTAEALGMETIDLTDTFCGDESCPAVIGHTLVYRDTASHLTATFSRTLSSALVEQISELLPAS